MFYIDSKISGSDYITSSAGDGKIVINGIEIRGNALPFQPKTGEVIPMNGVWKILVLIWRKLLVKIVSLI